MEFWAWLVAYDGGFRMGGVAFEAASNEKPPGVHSHCEARVN